MKKKSLLIIVALLAAFLSDKYQISNILNEETVGNNNSSALITAFNQQQSDKIVTASGTVIKTLRDDNKGSRHQKFIVRISPELSILIAHNIDLAPRINDIRAGDEIEFKGEYEWNNKGGVVHWTHHDPRGSHPAGWIKHQNKLYQ